MESLPPETATAAGHGAEIEAMASAKTTSRG
jgi:hypothetical protein